MGPNGIDRKEFVSVSMPENWSFTPSK